MRRTLLALWRIESVEPTQCKTGRRPESSAPLNQTEPTSVVRAGEVFHRPRHHRAGPRLPNGRHRQTDCRRQIRLRGVHADGPRSPSKSGHPIQRHSEQPWPCPHPHSPASPQTRNHEPDPYPCLSRFALCLPGRMRKRPHPDPARSSGTRCSRHRYSSSDYSLSSATAAGLIFK
jgi:hypothetical protein